MAESHQTPTPQQILAWWMGTHGAIPLARQTLFLEHPATICLTEMPTDIVRECVEEFWGLWEAVYAAQPDCRPIHIPGPSWTPPKPGRPKPQSRRGKGGRGTKYR